MKMLKTLIIVLGITMSTTHLNGQEPYTTMALLDREGMPLCHFANQYQFNPEWIDNGLIPTSRFQSLNMNFVPEELNVCERSDTLAILIEEQGEISEAGNGGFRSFTLFLTSRSSKMVMGISSLLGCSRAVLLDRRALFEDIRVMIGHGIHISALAGFLTGAVAAIKQPHPHGAGWIILGSLTARIADTICAVIVDES